MNNLREELEEERRAGIRAEAKFMAIRDQNQSTRESIRLCFEDLQKNCELESEVKNLNAKLERLDSMLHEREAMLQTDSAAFEKARNAWDQKAKELEAVSPILFISS